MRIAVYLFAFLATFLGIFADEVSENLEGHQLSEIKIKYVIEEYPDHRAAEVIEAFTSDTITLAYTITNDEEQPVTLIGFGGAFRDPLTGEALVNMTANAADNMVIEPHSTASIRQVIKLDFVPHDYVLSPTLYVAFDDSIKGLLARGQSISLKDAPVSFLDPRLLLLEILFVAIVGGVFYNFYYKASNKSARRVKRKASEQVSGLASSWAPKQHTPGTKTSKNRKRY